MKCAIPNKFLAAAPPEFSGGRRPSYRLGGRLSVLAFLPFVGPSSPIGLASAPPNSLGEGLSVINAISKPFPLWSRPSQEGGLYSLAMRRRRKSNPNSDPKS